MLKTSLVGTSEVAQALGCNVRTVVRMVRAGQLEPTVKMPGRTGAYLFDPADVAALASERAR